MDSTYVKAQRSAFERGARTQAIGPARGDQTAKVRVFTETLGTPCDRCRASAGLAFPSRVAYLPTATADLRSNPDSGKPLRGNP
jgi:hypothetical protein